MSTELTSNAWHVVVKTENGNVSLIRNLPLAQAVKVYESLDPWREHTGRGWRLISGGDVKTREILGPDGWDGCHRAMKHAIDFKEGVCDDGPNKGQTYRSGTCSHCGVHQFFWNTLTDGK